jgi:uncharacterized protein (TIGR00730 family)
MERFKSICVFCGSSTGQNPLYTQAAVELAEYIVTEGYRLVNGGGSIGLMGVMANHVLELGGEAVGVIPISLKEREVAHLGMTELIVVPDMHSRKLTMVNLSDAFIALPGGYGTMDELFETLTWLQLHLHNKPIGLLNVDGFYDPLLHMLDQMVEQRFLKPDARAYLHTDQNISSLFEKLRTPIRSNSEKWFDELIG